MSAPVITPVTISRIDRADWDTKEVMDGQSVLYGAYGFTSKQFDPIVGAWERATGSYDAHPALTAWDAMLDEVFAELEPKIADLFYEAINKRLPWTWTPPNDR